jgi:hypothetical protein
MTQKSLFPEEMINSSGMSIESIAAKLMHFEMQLQLQHWQTTKYAEHEALGGLYEYVHSFRDGTIEKLMGYISKRPSVFKIDPIVQESPVNTIIRLGKFAYELYVWAGNNNYCDVENLAQELSGETAKIKYLLTLS